MVNAPRSTNRGELSRLLDVRGNALVVAQSPLARAFDRLVREQRRGELRRQFPAGRGVGRELPLERFRGNAVVEKVLLHAILGADRFVDPRLGSAARLAHVLAQGALARRDLDAVTRAPCASTCASRAADP